MFSNSTTGCTATKPTDKTDITSAFTKGWGQRMISPGYKIIITRVFVLGWMFRPVLYHFTSHLSGYLKICWLLFFLFFFFWDLASAQEDMG